MERDSLGHNIETKLEGARAKNKILEEELAQKDEEILQYWRAIKSIRATMNALPENWQAKLVAGFCPAKHIEAIEQILSVTTVDMVEWMTEDDEIAIKDVAAKLGVISPEDKKKRGDSNKEIENRIKAEKGFLNKGSELTTESKVAQHRVENATKK